MEIKRGSVVQLKSGSPSMTVIGFLSKEDGKQYQNGVKVSILNMTTDKIDEYIVCQWFDNNVDKFKKEVFYISTLEIKE